MSEYFTKKADEGKPRLDLLPFKAIEEVGKILEYGTHKYSEDSWRNVPDALKRYTAALLRHISKFQQGETHDLESGLHHLSHAACNALFICELTAGENANIEEVQHQEEEVVVDIRYYGFQVKCECLQSLAQVEEVAAHLGGRYVVHRPTEDTADVLIQFQVDQPLKVMTSQEFLEKYANQ